LVDDVYEVLLPDASYFRVDADDDTRYSIDASVIDALAFLVTSVGLPFLVSVAANRFTARREHASFGQLPSLEEQERLLAEIGEQLTRRQPSAHDPDAVDLATIAVHDVLREHGWPKGTALGSAQRIVALMAEHLDRSDA
jgi:hypothetical protein